MLTCPALLGGRSVATGAVVVLDGFDDVGGESLALPLLVLSAFCSAAIFDMSTFQLMVMWTFLLLRL